MSHNDISFNSLFAMTNSSYRLAYPQIATDMAQKVLQPPELAFQQNSGQIPEIKIQLMRLEEINEGRPQDYRQALANVYATLSAKDHTRLIYLLEGAKGKVTLYLGVAVNKREELSCKS